MSGYRLCQIGLAEKPFFIESISTNAFSIEEICYFMDSGVIALEGTPQEVFGSDNARIRDFLGRYSDDGALK